MEAADIGPELHIYIRTIMGMVLGLALGRLFAGLAKFVQTAEERRIYLTHIVWVAYLFFAIVTFWWWEVQLVRVTDWTLWSYLFLIAYTGSFFFLCALLFPDDLRGGDGYATYLIRRRHWFFAILALNLGADFIDTAIKGWDYFQSLGVLYPIRNLVLIGLCLVAIRTASLRFHAVFALAALIAEVGWTVWEYRVPNV